METDTNNKLPQQENISPELPISERDQPSGASPNKPKITKKKLLWISLIVLFFGSGAAAYFFFFNDNNKKPVENAIETEETAAIKDVILTYATKLGKTSKVYVKNVTEDATEEELSFAEPYEFSSENGNAWENSKSSVDLNSEGTELAYITDNNLIVRNISTDKEETIIKNTATSGSSDSIITITLDPAPPKTVGPGLSLIASPIWSRDSKNIGLKLGFYEGGAVQVINRLTKQYTSLGDTFRYAEMIGIPTSKFTILSENKALAELGIFGQYLIKEDTYLSAPGITLDGKKVLAILCPADQPNTGNSKYSESGTSATELAELKKQRDCGETGNRSLISINLSDGSYKEVGTGKFELSLAQQSPNLVYVAGGKDSGYNTTKIDLSGSSTSSLLDIKKLGALNTNDSIEGVIVKNAGDAPVAEIYTKNSGKQYVKIVDLKTEKLITTISLEANMGYTTLGLSQ